MAVDFRLVQKDWHEPEIQVLHDKDKHHIKLVLKSGMRTATAYLTLGQGVSVAEDIVEALHAYRRPRR